MDALPAAEGDCAALDVRRMGVRAVVLRGGFEGESLLLGDGFRTIRFDVCSGTLTDGPVRLRYLIEGMTELGHKLMTLRRLVALRRLGRFPAALFPIERRVGRWILMLRTLDALAAGASHQDIAEGLFGSAAVRGEWRARSDYLRLRVQRLARSATALSNGGFVSLLRSRPPI